MLETCSALLKFLEQTGLNKSSKALKEELGT